MNANKREWKNEILAAEWRRDASVCPHCHKQGGITYSFMLIGGMVGGAVGVAISYFMVFGDAGPEVDTGWAIICSLCVCNPVFWISVLPGMCVGVILGGISAYFVKKNIKEQGSHLFQLLF